MTDGAPHEYKETPGTCLACGNSPVNHLATYCVQSFSIWSSQAASRQGGLHAAIRSLGDSLFDRVEPYLYPIMAALPMVSFAHDPAGAYTYRSQVVWEEAQRRGIPMEQMMLFRSPTEIYRARLGDSWKYFQSLPITTPSDTNPVEMDDKFLLKQKLRAAGIPAPRAVSVTTLPGALAVSAEWRVPLAIKPRVGSRGRHTTVNVRTPEDVAHAFKSAQKLCKYVVVEEYLEGSVCRGTVVGGKLAGFFQANPPKVTGDGRATIKELIAASNSAKPERVQEVVLTDETLAFLARGGYSSETILPTGITIPLTHRTGRLFGGRTRELLGHEHPKLRAYLERAAALLKTPIVGFDLIIPDPEADPDTQKWGIIEANSLPYIDLHYLPLEGAPSNVAAHVWDYVEAGIRRATA